MLGIRIVGSIRSKYVWLPLARRSAVISFRIHMLLQITIVQPSKDVMLTAVEPSRIWG